MRTHKQKINFGILKIFVVFLAFAIFVNPLSAKPLISEVQTDLSFRTGLEVETEYRDNSPGLGSLLREDFYYYEFHPITDLDRINVNPFTCSSSGTQCAAAWVKFQGRWCPEQCRTYKESETTGLTLDDLEYRKNFFNTNPLYWKAYTVGQGRYADVDYSLATYLSSKGVASISHEFGGPVRTFSKIFYSDDGRVLGEVDYGKVSGESITYETHSGSNKYRGFDSTTDAKTSTLEGSLGVSDLPDVSGGPKTVAVYYSPDSEMIQGSFNNLWNFKRPSRVKAWNTNSLGDWDIDDPLTNPEKQASEKFYSRVAESYRYDRFFTSPVFNGNFVSSIDTSTRYDESQFQACSAPMKHDYGFPCPDNFGQPNANARCDIGKPASIHNYDYDGKVSRDSDNRPIIWDDSYFDYDRCGNLIKTVNVGTYHDKNGLLKSGVYYTKVSYETANKAFPTKIEYHGDSESNPPLTKRASYYTHGLVQTTTDENNRVTNYNYDTLGRIEEIRFSDGGQGNYYYNTPVYVDGSNDERWTVRVVQKQSNSVNVETCNIYDFGGRLAQVHLKDSDKNRIIFSTTTYDSLGRVSNQYKPNSVSGTGSFCVYQTPSGLFTETQYDSLGRVKKIIYPGGDFTQFGYGSNYKTVTDEKGKTHTYYYDGFGNLEKVVDPQGTVFSLVYDDFFGNVERIEVSGAPISTLSESFYPYVPYQNGNPSLPFKVSSVEEGETSFKYDFSGNVIRSIDAEGIIKDVDYDQYNRISKTTAYKASDSDIKEEITFYYGGDSNCNSNSPPINNINRVCKVVGSSWKDGAQTFYVEDSYEYDELGRVTKKIQDINNEKSFTLIFDYDLAGNLIHLTYPDGKIVNYNYNSLNQLEGVSYTNTQGQTTAVDYSYNPIGTIEERQLTSNGIVKFYTTYSYNSRDFLTSIFASEVKNLRTGDVYFERTYGFDKAGNIDKIAYSVDLANRGNMPSTLNYETFTYDNLNRLAGANYYGSAGLYKGFTYQYDALGNRIIETSTSPSYTKTYVYENNKLAHTSGGT